MRPYIHYFLLPQGSFISHDDFNASAEQVIFTPTSFIPTTSVRVFSGGSLVTIKNGVYNIVGSNIVFTVAPTEGTEVVIFRN